MCKLWLSVPNDYCYQSHRVNKLSGKLTSYCDFLSQLRNCHLCIQDFELSSIVDILVKKGLMVNICERGKRADDEVLIGNSFSGTGNNNYVKCSFCSGFT